MRERYDVIEVGMDKPHKVRVIDCLKSFKNADAVMKMAVARRGVGDHFFKVVPAGEYRDEEAYRFG
jgi:hypothetical protein